MTRLRSTAPQRHLVVMMKEPHPGRVKTRLGRDIGMVEAAWWYRHQVTRLLRKVNHPRRWRLWLAVSPDIEGLKSRVWPGHFDRIAQGEGNLGDRMTRVFRSLPPGPAVIIGSDIPGIDTDKIASAFRRLTPGTAVIGPAEDGGYWSIGLPRCATPTPQNLFQNVRWSGPHAMHDTVVSLGGMPLNMLTKLRDVDLAKDLQELSSPRDLFQST